MRGPSPSPPDAVFGLDLLRALAVSLVLASHGGDMMAPWFGRASWPAMSYGAFYGIELFYVLSGFLIGGLLLRALDAAPQDRGSLLYRSWRIFMLRRWMRTLPLYWLWLAVLAVFWAPVLWPGTHRVWGAVALFAPVLQNLAWPIRDGNFFDVSWSLAVEEWFYLGFALLLFALGRGARRVALPVAVLMFLAGPAVARWGMLGSVRGDHLVIFWLDSIAWGVVAAWVAARRPRLFHRNWPWLLPGVAVAVWASGAGGLGLLGAGTRLRQVLDVDVLAAGLCLALPAACAWRQAQGGGAWLVRLLARYSYPLYLTHLSVLVWVDYRRRAAGWSPVVSVAMAVGLTAVLSWALGRFVERPVMRLRPRDMPAPQPNQAKASNAAIPAAEAAQAAVAPGGA